IREFLDRDVFLGAEQLAVGGPLEKLGAHLGNASRQFEETSRAFERFTTRLDAVAEKASAETEGAGSSALPPLPPS
ncbi:MAG TPA: hypothetical protein VKG23_09740, partial [Thermoanaerobaculia bacterium]|nr:hypothetical protein [Thermoanaerobaculia bacterium]